MEQNKFIRIPATRKIGWMIEVAITPWVGKDFHIWEAGQNINGFMALMKWLDQKFINDDEYTIHCVSWYEADCCSKKHSLKKHARFKPSEFKHQFGLRKGEFWMEKNWQSDEEVSV